MLSRRAFVASLTASGALLLAPRAGAADAAWSVADPPGSTELGPWLLIAPDGATTIRVAHSEMGQGIFTTLPMLVAEELDCDWRHVRAEYADEARNRRDNAYGSMATGGSHSIRSSWEMLRLVGAVARARLVAAAAKRWGVVPGDCTTENGVVRHAASGRSAAYGELVREAASVTLAREPALKPPSAFRIIGTSVPRLDSKAKCDGSAVFGIDVRLPGMLYAAVSLCPVPGGRLVSHDAAAVMSRRGVKAVVAVPGGVGVVADRFWRAQQAAAALPVTWDTGAAGHTDSAQFAAMYRKALDGELAVARRVGDAQAAMQGTVVEALYEVPYLAHAPMEPLNATAHVHDGMVEVWLGTQNPAIATMLAARAAGVGEDKVVVHNCFLGGGFGRRTMNDEVVQAVTVAKAVQAPVQLMWTRETDIRHDRFRPQAAIRLRGAVAGGEAKALSVATAVGSITRSLWGGDPGPVEGSAVEGLANTPYAFANLLVRCRLLDTHIPVMFWRSVGNSQNAFAMESFVDEMAHAAGADPYRFRRGLLAHRPDMVRVLDTVAEKSGWGAKLPARHGRGIAIHESFGTIAAEVVEVAVDQAGAVRVIRVVAAVDCGTVVDPHIAAMQVESAVIYGLSAALYEAVTVRDGAVTQGNFDAYRVMHMADAPAIETHLVPSGRPIGGLGEPGTPPAAPALCNAIFAATGVRVRSLPIAGQRLGGTI